MQTTTSSAAYLAAHRFGWSETSVRAIASDPQGWVLAQWRQPQAPSAEGLADSAQMWRMAQDRRRAKRQNARTDRQAGAPATAMDERDALRQANLAALSSRWNHIVSTSTPVAERWVQFWANHFCVSGTRGTVAPLVWAYEREAIRPHAFGSLFQLLRAATLHPAMLLYLDNAQSIGPQSVAGQRREKGLNENLARELLELHTLGVNGGYTQADVTQTAQLLTGWTLSPQNDGRTVFVERAHQPGPKTILGRRYAQGPQAVDALLNDLVRHPATAQHLATQLARHFVTDQPPADLVEAVARTLRNTEGDLTATAHTLFTHRQTWAEHPPKWKRPEEWVLSAHRLLKWPLERVPPTVALLTDMGQPPGRPPSPQGWADVESEWLSPHALWQRVRWAEAFARQHGADADARMLADLSLGPLLSDTTRQELSRAESGAQALALLLASPEFQRR